MRHILRRAKKEINITNSLEKDCALNEKNSSNDDSSKIFNSSQIDIIGAGFASGQEIYLFFYSLY